MTTNHAFPFKICSIGFSISWTSQYLPKLYGFFTIVFGLLSFDKFSGNDFRRLWTVAKALTDASQQVYLYLCLVTLIDCYNRLWLTFLRRHWIDSDGPLVQ